MAVVFSQNVVDDDDDDEVGFFHRVKTLALKSPHDKEAVTIVDHTHLVLASGKSLQQICKYAVGYWDNKRILNLLRIS